MCQWKHLVCWFKEIKADHNALNSILKMTFFFLLLLGFIINVCPHVPHIDKGCITVCADKKQDTHAHIRKKL